MRLHRKPEGDEALRLIPKKRESPFRRGGQDRCPQSTLCPRQRACVHMCAYGGRGRSGNSVLVEKHLTAESPADTQQVLCLVKGTNHGRGSADTPHETWGKRLTDKCSPRALATCGCLLAQVPMTLWRPPLDQSPFLKKGRGSLQSIAGQEGPRV